MRPPLDGAAVKALATEHIARAEHEPDVDDLRCVVCRAYITYDACEDDPPTYCNGCAHTVAHSSAIARAALDMAAELATLAAAHTRLLAELAVVREAGLNIADAAWLQNQARVDALLTKLGGDRMTVQLVPSDVAAIVARWSAS